MEYDLVQLLDGVAAERDGKEEAEAAGYILIVGGAQTSWFYSAPAVYSAPTLGVIYLGVYPDG